MIPKSLRSFMKNLLEATEENTVSWSEGALPDTYYCTHKTFNLHISYFFHEDAEIGNYWFKINEGNKNASFNVKDTEDDFEFMQSFFSAVTVNASGFENISENFFK